MADAGAFGVPLIFVAIIALSVVYVLVFRAARNRNLLNPRGGVAELRNLGLRRRRGLTQEKLDEMFPAKPLYIAIQEMMEMGVLKDDHLEATSTANTAADKDVSKTMVSTVTESEVFVEDVPVKGAEDIENELPEHSDIADQRNHIQMIEESEDSIYKKDCVICQGPIAGDENSGVKKEDVMVRLLSCGHLFHDECISLWLTQKAVCPICSKPFIEQPSSAEPVPEEPVEPVPEGPAPEDPAPEDPAPEIRGDENV